MGELERDDLLDAIDDLAHDLGKHARLPLRMTPIEVDEQTVRAAGLTGLLRTRRSPRGDMSAEDIWARFKADVGNNLSGLSSWQPLGDAVDTALAWIPVLQDQTRGFERHELDRDLLAISKAIRTLREELDD